MWHAIFLCGSRGALISTAVMTLACLFYSRSKTLSIIVICALILAIITQGKFLLNRAQDTIQRNDAPIDQPIDPRIESWQASIRMIIDHPIWGVGTERFQSAYPDYQAGQTHVAHNTFFQIAANNGLPSGFIYVMIFYSAWRSHKKIKKETPPNTDFAFLNDAIFCSMIGFFICSIFLDLLISEILYFLLLLNFSKKEIHAR
ncbi:MAG: O-antigen ligase family protein, partial [Gammaproteobacteria bacterium]